MWRRAGVLCVVLGLVLTGCGGGDPLAGGGAARDPGAAVRIGSANFTESSLLAEIYAQALEAEGIPVERRFGIGSREVYLRALQDGSIDLMPEYLGSLYSALADRGDLAAAPPVSTADEVDTAVRAVLPDGLQLLTRSAAENRNTISVTPATATRYNLSSIADLAPVAAQLAVGASPEWAERHQGRIGLEQVYGVVFREIRTLDSGGTLTKAALADGTIDAGSIFSTDPLLGSGELLALADPRNVFLAENVTPLVRDTAATPALVAALDRVSAALTTENLTANGARVAVDQDDPATVATDFLTTLPPP